MNQKSKKQNHRVKYPFSDKDVLISATSKQIANLGKGSEDKDTITVNYFKSQRKKTSDK